MSCSTEEPQRVPTEYFRVAVGRILHPWWWADLLKNICGVHGQSGGQLGDRANPAGGHPTYVSARNVVEHRIIVDTGENREVVEVPHYGRVVRDMKDVRASCYASKRLFATQIVHQREVRGSHRPAAVMGSRPKTAAGDTKVDSPFLGDRVLVEVVVDIKTRIPREDEHREQGQHNYHPRPKSQIE